MANRTPTSSPSLRRAGARTGERRRLVGREASRARYLSAGEILFAGLVCFGLWFAFDARQLYTAATNSPLGVRRSVSMSITRPVARVEEFLSLDRIVDAANRIIGKTGSPGGSVTTVTTAPPVTSSTAPARSHPSGARASTTTTTAPPKTLGVAQPTAAHPLTILDIGDSIGEDLGIGLAAAIGANPAVHVLQDSVGDTGLANLGYYDWLTQLPVELRAHHPKVVVVMLGGNDAQSFLNGGTVVDLGTAQWRAVYTARVAQLMREATATGARVIWVGLPIMGPTSGLSNTQMELQNSIYEHEAGLFPGVTYVSTWRLFENAAGQYATYLPVDGALVEVRDTDEVHIDPPGGTDLVGDDVVAQMEHLWHIKL